MTFGTRIIFDELREVIFAAVTANFTPLGAPTIDVGRILILTSTLDQPVYISFDEITNHIRMFQNSIKTFDFCSNKVRNDGLFLSVKTQISVKAVSTLPTTGTIWAEIVSAAGGK